MLPDVPEQSAAGRDEIDTLAFGVGRSPGRPHGASSSIPDVVADDAITATMRSFFDTHETRSSCGPRKSASRQRCDTADFHLTSRDGPGNSRIQGRAAHPFSANKQSFSLGMDVQQAQTAHLPAITTARARWSKLCLRWPLAFSCRRSRLFAHQSPFITPLTMSTTPMRFPVTDARCPFSDLFLFGYAGRADD